MFFGYKSFDWCFGIKFGYQFVHLVGDNSPAAKLAGEICGKMIDAALMRDLDAAIIKSSMAEATAAGEIAAESIYPARFSLQTNWATPERKAP